MTLMQWAIISGVWWLLCVLLFKWLRRATYVPIPGREQDVRDIMRGGVSIDISQALAAGARLEAAVGPRGPSDSQGAGRPSTSLPGRDDIALPRDARPSSGPRPYFLGDRR